VLRTVDENWVIITAGWYHESAVISYRYRQFVLPTGIDG
jgi:hypothetical protein